jgi:hypothetical protein
MIGMITVCALAAASAAAATNPMHPPKIPGPTSCGLIRRKRFESARAVNTPISPPKTPPIKSPTWLAAPPKIDPSSAVRPANPDTKKNRIICFKGELLKNAGLDYVLSRMRQPTPLIHHSAGGPIFYHLGLEQTPKPQSCFETSPDNDSLSGLLQCAAPEA